MKKAAVVERIEDAEAARRAATDDPALVWVSSDERTAEALRRGGVSCRWLRESFDEAAAARVETEAWRLARSWHAHPAVRPLVEYRGRNVGELAELYTGLHLTWILTTLVCARAFQEAESPAEILFFETPRPQVKGFFPAPGEPLCEDVFRFLGARTGRLQGGAPAASTEKPLSSWKSALRAPLFGAYRFLVRPFQVRCRADVLFVSAPKHVEAVIAHLDRGAAYLDEDFRWAKLPFLAKAGVPYYSYPELRSRIGAEGRERLEAFRRNFPGTEEALRRTVESGAFRSPEGDLSRLFEPRLRFFFDRWLPETAERVEAFESFLAGKRFAAVVVDEDTVTFRKTLVGEARRLGTKTVQIPHGVNFSDFQYDLFPVSSEAVALGGEGIRAYYNANGSRARVHLTGIPRYDRIRATQDPTALRRRFGTAGNRKLIVFWGTTLFPAIETRRNRFSQRRALVDTLTVLGGRSDCTLVVKRHPLDLEPEWTEDAVRASGIEGVRIAPADVPAGDLLAAADLTLSFHSNALIESLVLGKPSIALDYFPLSRTRVPVFVEEGSALCARDAASLKTLVDRALSGEPSFLELVSRVGKRLEREWVGPLDGRSGARVAEAIGKEAG